MSVDTVIKGLIPVDEKYKKMLSVYRQCEELDIEVPDEVATFFDDREPDDDGMQVDIDSAMTGDIDHEGGVIIDLDKLPPNIRKIKVENCC
jgi:hypothetical protein